MGLRFIGRLREILAKYPSWTADQEATMAVQEHQIIAGYDGSNASADALDWAVREARLRDLPLTIWYAFVPGYTAAGDTAAG